MLTALTVATLLVIVLLAVPLTLAFDISWRRELRNDMELRWALGLVRLRIRTPKPRAESGPRDERDDRSEDRARTGKRKSYGNVFAAIRRPDFRHRVIRFIRDLWHAIHKENVFLRLRIGLGDPADTGQLWALCGPLAGLLANTADTAIALEPDFVDANLEFDSSGSLRVVPLQVVYLCAALLLSPAIWQGVRQMRVAT